MFQGSLTGLNKKIQKLVTRPLGKFKTATNLFSTTKATYDGNLRVLPLTVFDEKPQCYATNFRGQQKAGKK